MLDIINITKSYVRDGTSTTVLDNVSFKISDRQFVSILGPSGCGKSTLLRCMAGLSDASSGSIAIDGKDIDGPSPQMVYVFQEYGRSLFPWRRLLNNVAYPLEGAMGKKAGIEQARKYIKLVGLAGFEKHYPWELSGGMQQRAAIARALVKEPQYLLMDEPFGALDAQTRTQLEDSLLDIWSSSPRTVVFVTHDIDEAIYLSDRVIVMGARPGRIVKDMTIDLPRPRNQITTKEARQFSDYRRQLLELISPALAEHE